jgi:hypothetical protein
MKTKIRFSFITLSALLAVMPGLPFGVPAQTATVTTTAPTDATGDKLDKLLRSLNNTSRLDEIAQLTKAGVGDPVILTYIQNSETAYNVNAQDIIKLRDQGVSSEVTTALIQRGMEVRQAAQEATKQVQATAVAASPTDQAPSVGEVTAPAPVQYVTTPVQPASTVSVTYFGSPSYSYAPVCYPRYVVFGSSYCYTPQVAFGVGFGGHRFRGHRSNTGYYR